MAPTQFKLTKLGGLTRRITFGEQPSWLSLATKIESLYGIPVEKVAVSYIDTDDDEVTLSSHEELVDFYTHTYHRGEAIKFTVVDLGSLRAARGPTSQAEDEAKTTPRGMNNLGPGLVGPGMLFEVDDSDWQRLPSFPDMFGVPRTSGSPTTGHAFVEVVESDTQSQKENDPSLSEILEHPTAAAEKGKGKACDDEMDGISSTGTVLEEEIPIKPDVHVYDMSDRGGCSPPTFMTPRVSGIGPDDPISSSPKVSNNLTTDNHYGWSSPLLPHPPSVIRARASTRSSSPSTNISDGSKPLPKTPSTRPSHPLSPSPVVFAPADSLQGTPKQPKNVLDEELFAAKSAPDPPLEPTGASNHGQASPSLANDVANLLDTLLVAFSSHPELSEGMRNIVRNTTNGVYWPAEQENFNHATEILRRAAQDSRDTINDAVGSLRRNTEAEAGRRVAEALGGVFRVIGEITSGINNMAIHATPTHPATGVGHEAEKSPRPDPTVALQGESSSHHPTSSPENQWMEYGRPPPPPPPNMFPPSPPPPGFFPPPFGPPPHFGPPHFGSHPRHGPHPHFGRPPAPHHGRGPHHSPHYNHPLGPSHGPPMPPPPPPPPPPGTSTAEPALPPHQRSLPWWMEQLANNPGTGGLRRMNTWSAGTHPAFPPPAADVEVGPIDPFNESSHFSGLDGPDRRIGAHERKAQLEVAKAFYKAEKERFRREKEERRRARREVDERRAEEGLSHNNTQNEETIVARIPLGTHRNFPMGYGQGMSKGVHLPPRRKGTSFAEVYSVPQQRHSRPREHRFDQGASSQNQPGPQDLSKPSLEDRVIARLADMGFTTATHGNIPTLLEQYSRTNGALTKDSEDTVVTKMLEALISEETRLPHPSGSNQQS